jgi:hypothetical protein
MTSLLRCRMTLWSGMFALAGALLLLPATAAAALYTFGCHQNSDCRAGATCTETVNLFVLRWTECRATACNDDKGCAGGTTCQLGQCTNTCTSDSNCRTGFNCTNGTCKAPAQAPAPGAVPGEGRKCNPPNGSKPADWALDSNGKPLGACAQGTTCSNNGFCVKLPT